MMYPASHKIPRATSPCLAPQDAAPQDEADCKPLYFAMLEENGDSPGQIDERTRASSRTFLLEQLSTAAEIKTDFPDDMASLPHTLRSSHDRATQAYQRYLQERRSGAPRRYFSCRSHALYFLRSVAPTKLVDGAWLYGLLQRWQDPRLAPLVQTYLEELGCGSAQQNHVLLYRHLLARYGCDHWQDGPDQHFTQGSVQLALGHNACEFLPELIGFNLGYEQLPLHLLITAYELNELDIDPYYFTLHVTIDNASTGHARKALQSVLDCTPKIGDVAKFYRRLGNGYRLNLVGMNTPQAIASFDLERELLRVLGDKAAIGARMHADYCLIGGRPISDWLAAPTEMADLLSALQDNGWIRRGEEPQQSRFWRLLTDEQAPMFGVFNGYEQQILQDWIRNEAVTTPASRATNRFPRHRPALEVESTAVTSQSGATTEQVIAHHAGLTTGPDSCADVNALFRKLDGVRSKAEALALLTGMLSPANHPTPAGLAATRLYADLFQQLI